MSFMMVYSFSLLTNDQSRPQVEWTVHLLIEYGCVQSSSGVCVYVRLNTLTVGLSHVMAGSKSICFQNNVSQVIYNTCFQNNVSQVIYNTCFQNNVSQVIYNSCFQNNVSQVIYNTCFQNNVSQVIYNTVSQVRITVIT